MAEKNQKKMSPEEEIKTYKMVEGNYTISVKILEASDLIPTFSGMGFMKSKGSAVDAFVEINCLDKFTRKTKVKKGQVSPIFNQMFNFKFDDLKKQQLSSGVITFTVFDKKLLMSNAVVGAYQLDISSVYFSYGHELYRSWLTLSDPTDERYMDNYSISREGLMGYLLVNVSVLGPTDEPIVHDVTTDKKAGATSGKSLMPQKIKQYPQMLEVHIYKGENMPPLDMTSPDIDAYVIVKYSGIKSKSSVNTSRNPEWNQILQIAYMLPNQSKQISFEVFDEDLVGDDDMVGCFKVNYKDVKQELSEPRWVNLYGAPLQGQGQHADLMTLFGETLGSTYRGRILYAIRAYPMANPKTRKINMEFKFPENPMPVCEQRSYILRVDLLECLELPPRERVFIQISMGPYLLCSKEVKTDGSSAILYETIPDKKVLFPKDITQVPDIIFYYADEKIEHRRHCFARIKASDALDKPRQAQVVKFKEDRSLDLVTDDEFPGFLYANVQLLSQQPGLRKPFEIYPYDKVDYQLRVYLFVGRGLPPADATGACDPFVKIRCAGETAESQVREQTLNPNWYQTIIMNVQLYPLDRPQPVPAGMFVMVYDEDKNDDGERSGTDLIGRIWITLQPDLVTFQSEEGDQIDILLRKPKWYNIWYDATDEVAGKILLGYTLVKQSDAEQLPKESMVPHSTKQKLHFFVIGLRDIDAEIGDTIPEKCSVSFDVSGDDNEAMFTDAKPVLNGGLTLNRLISLELDVPNNQNFCPILDVYMWEESDPLSKQLLGLSSIELGRILESYYHRRTLPPGVIEEEESDEDEKELLEALKKDKQQQNDQEQAKVEEDNQEVDLAKIDLKVPWELPIKRKVMENAEYEQRMKEIEEQKKNFEDLAVKEREVLQENYVVLKFEEEEEKDLDKYKEKPKFQQTVYNQNFLQPVARAESSQFDFFQQPQRHQGEGVQDEENSQEIEQPVQNEFNRLVFQEKEENIQGVFKSQVNRERRVFMMGAGQQQKQKDESQSHQGSRQGQSSQGAIRVEASRQDLGTPQGIIRVEQPSQRSSNLSHQYDQQFNQQHDPLAEQQSENQIFNPMASQKDVRSSKSKKSEVSMISKISVRELQGIDQKIFLEPEKHIKNQRRGSSVSMSMSRISQASVPLMHRANLDPKNEKKQLYSDLSIYPLQAPLSQKMSGVKSIRGSIPNLTQQNISKLQQRLILNTLQVPSDLQFSEPSKVSSHALSINSGMKDNNEIKELKDGKSSKKKNFRDNKMKFSMMQGLTKSIKKKNNDEVETYEDFDTEPEEDLNVEHVWLKGREMIPDDFEDRIKPSKKFMRFPLMYGSKRGASSQFSTDKPPEPQQVAILKCIFLEERPGVDIAKKKQFYTNLMRPKDYICRAYILEGQNIQYEPTPEIYLNFKLCGKNYDRLDQTLQSPTNNPQFYYAIEMPCQIPGSSVLRIEVMARDTFNDELIGYTEIDLEDRYFTPKWHSYNMKPLECRNIKDESGSSMGRLKMWIDLVEKSQAKQNPMIQIEPPIHVNFELRTIVWETRNCVFKDELEKCNDVFCKGGPANLEAQETDTHWRCRSKGSFNWRMKYKTAFPMKPDEYGNDRFKMQLWDKDLIDSNDLIGETDVDLNTHRMIEKFKLIYIFRGVKRRKSVKMLLRIREKGGIVTERFWFDVFHPEVLDEEGNKISQGQVLMSFELMPVDEAIQKPNGLGRDPPNVFPSLSEPVGRLSFDITNPLAFIKDIIGPDLYSKMCRTIWGIACIVFFCTFGWIFFSQMITSAIV